MAATLSRWRKLPVSNIEKEFIIKALRAGYRLDGRDALECREVDFKFSLDGSSCLVKLGHSMVMVSVSARLEQPYSDRQNEGSLRFDVTRSPMADIEVQDTVELGRLIERGLKESRAVDLEALCVQPGRRVWNLYIDACILDNCGNIIDALGLAALAALSSFRRPAVTIDSDAPGGVIIHSPRDKEPIPVALHHHPVPITFAFFENGALMAIDPESKEEATAEGTFTVTVTKHRELCAAQKSHGIGISTKQVMQCLNIASERAGELVHRMQKALEANEMDRVAARVRKKSSVAGHNNEVQVQEQMQMQERDQSMPPLSEGPTVVDMQALDSEKDVSPQQMVQEQHLSQGGRSDDDHGRKIMKTKAPRNMDHKQVRRKPKKRSKYTDNDSKISDTSVKPSRSNVVRSLGVEPGNAMEVDPLEEIGKVIAAAGGGQNDTSGDLRNAFKIP